MDRALISRMEVKLFLSFLSLRAIKRTRPPIITVADYYITILLHYYHYITIILLYTTIYSEISGHISGVYH
jgi:hypothetical protein